ncbi:hypothetical protein PINS_up017782 [Pythium insidiosum]|nr:hypothetical protein PINS_up017782 [Pythium insidiosum]
MSKVCALKRSADSERDFFQLEISFALPRSGALDESATDQVGDFYALLLAFDTEEDLLEWAHAIYDCCTNSMSIKANATLGPLEEIQMLPRELLKISTFEEPKHRSSDVATVHHDFSASGWLYYRTSNDERIRQRYFVQWGYELSIYKHEVLAHEATAIRYGVIDCRALEEVRFAYINSPENAVELVLGSGTRVVLIPRTDEEAVMWHNALRDAKLAYGSDDTVSAKNDALGPGLYISRGSTFATQKDNEELLRSQIEASVVYSTNLQEWDGKKWIPKYFVLTTSRVLVLSLALHLYDEEPDILGSFATRDIIEVKSCGDNDCVDIGSAHTACIITLRQSSNAAAGSRLSIESSMVSQERLLLRCDSIEHCLEWMRLLCASNGKLELKKNAATGLWGSVNRIASLSRHHSLLSFVPMTPPSASLTGSGGRDTLSGIDRASRRLSRMDATKKRTTELILSRKMSATAR